MLRIVFSLLLLLVFYVENHAQSKVFVLKGGPTLGLQKWDDNFERQPLLRYHGALAVESYADDNAVFAQIGFHVKGSSNRTRILFQGGGEQNLSQSFTFNNLSLVLGVKQKKPLTENSRYFYSGGLRGDYTLSTNVDNLLNSASSSSYPFLISVYPFVGGVQRWMAGLSIGGGIEVDFADLVGAQFELTFNPDITPQYRQGSLPNVIIPGQGTITIPERRIRNTTLEFSVGLRLLRKVVYDE